MFTTAWIVGLTLSVWNRLQSTVTPGMAAAGQSGQKAVQKRYPPSPRSLLMASVLFTGLAVLADVPDARKVATLAAYGFDLSVLIQILSRPKGQYTYYAGDWPPASAPGNVVIPTGLGGPTIVNGQLASTSTSTQAGGTGTVTT